ncbi:hypothetical protein VTL71DRAFT_6758 [Oculimacula yallundae]|uniref:C2H2-type domain-containing protein n=1 Tax=Oculimacula yallundae TaxID=86028 RepID=A0ABR4BYT7_9HELO
MQSLRRTSEQLSLARESSPSCFEALKASGDINMSPNAQHRDRRNTNEGQEADKNFRDWLMVQEEKKQQRENERKNENKRSEQDEGAKQQQFEIVRRHNHHAPASFRNNTEAAKNTKNQRKKVDQQPETFTHHRRSLSSSSNSSSLSSGNASGYTEDDQEPQQGPDKRWLCLRVGCPDTFRDKSSMYRHIDSWHKKIKSHLCDICGKAFHDKRRRITHLKSKNVNGGKCNRAWLAGAVPDAPGHVGPPHKPALGQRTKYSKAHAPRRRRAHLARKLQEIQYSRPTAEPHARTEGEDQYQTMSQTSYGSAYGRASAVPSPGRCSAIDPSTANFNDPPGVFGTLLHERPRHQNLEGMGLYAVDQYQTQWQAPQAGNMNQNSSRALFAPLPAPGANNQHTLRRPPVNSDFPSSYPAPLPSWKHRQEPNLSRVSPFNKADSIFSPNHSPGISGGRNLNVLPDHAKSPVIEGFRDLERERQLLQLVQESMAEFGQAPHPNC